MFRKLKEKNKFSELLLLGTFTLFCFGISLFRVFYSETNLFLFLNWNLFLAFIPWALTTCAIVFDKMRSSKIVILLIMAVWLLFFPNAPYILTDLFHLRLHTSLPVWFDLVLILSFAWTGLLFGFVSLFDIEELLQRTFNLKRTVITIISICLLFLGSFGVYLGRYLRWNSWDLITQPFQLLYDIGDRFVNPFMHPRTWGVTIFFGLFLTMLYFSFRFFKTSKPIR